MVEYTRIKRVNKMNLQIDLIAKVFGYAAAVLNVLALVMKKRRYLLIVSLMASVFCALNVLFLGKYSAALIFVVGISQSSLNFFREIMNSKSGKWEYYVFLGGYIIVGIITYKEILDILPLAASILYMLAIQEKNMTRIRLIFMGNATLWIIYYFIVRSTAIYGQIVTIFVLVYMLIKENKKPKNTPTKS